MNQVPARDLETMPRESSGRVELPCEVQLCVAAAMLRNTPGDEIKTTTVALRQPALAATGRLQQHVAVESHSPALARISKAAGRGGRSEFAQTATLGLGGNSSCARPRLRYGT